MKTNLTKIAFLGLVLLLSMSSCSKKTLQEDKDDAETSIIPADYRGRPIDVAGTISVTSKTVTFKVWDSGTIDGDIISLVVNGKVVLDNFTLTASKHTIPVTLDNTGYNYVLLYAHNEGTISPNTAALSVLDSTGTEQNLVLSANLQTNAAYNIIVQ